MRVALYMDPPYIGGAERHFVDLCEGLLESGTEIAILAPQGPLPPYVEARLGPVSALHVLSPRPSFDGNFIANVRRALSPYGEMRGVLKTLDPDLIHIHNGGYPASHLARAAVFSHGGPRVMTINNRARDFDGWRDPDRLLDRAVFGALSAVITPSQATAERLMEARDVAAGLIRVIPYGIRPPAVSDAEIAAARTEMGAGEGFTIGMVAAPSTDPNVLYKGHDVFVEALGRLEEKDWQAVVVGHDPGERFLHRAEDLGIAPQVVVLPGFRPAASYITSFDVLVVPSTRNEALPLVIIEAMAMGTAVIASELSGVPEAIRNGVDGLLAKPGDPDDLAAQIERCLGNDSFTRQLAGAARARFKERFTLDAMVERTLDCYRGAVGTAAV